MGVQRLAKDLIDCHQRNWHMNDSSQNKLKERVIRAAEAALKANGSVGPLELFQYMGLLQPVHVESWRKGNEYYRTLERWIQVGPEKFQKTLQYFQEWVQKRGLRPIKAQVNFCR